MANAQKLRRGVYIGEFPASVNSDLRQCACGNFVISNQPNIRLSKIWRVKGAGMAAFLGRSRDWITAEVSHASAAVDRPLEAREFGKRLAKAGGSGQQGNEYLTARRRLETH